jgi:hypothetical protein
MGGAEGRMKRHARLGDASRRLLWVGEEADWTLMRREPRPLLLCPHDDCGERLHAVCSGRGTRFLRRGRGAGGNCPHWWVNVSGATGPESQRHLWLKARLASICLQLGWAAVPEDPTTYADVWVPDAAAAIEVQLRRTDTIARTAARLDAGAGTVIWFVAAGVPANRMLFHAPAVRFDVISPSQGESVQPWVEPCADARLVVFGTIWQWREWRLATGRMSAYTFLAEVLGDRMVWCPPGTPGLPLGRGGWVRWDDLRLALAAPQIPAEDRRTLLPVSQASWMAAQLDRRRTGRSRKGAQQWTRRSSVSSPT